MSKKDKSGIPLKEHLEQVERQIGRTPIELQGPDFPELLDHVWSAFILFSNCRSYGPSGEPLPISALEIKSRLELSGDFLTSFEISTIDRLDQVYLRTTNNG